MIIYAGINGTSAENDTDYENTFKDSFVRNLAYKYRSLWSEEPYYHRGPYTWGVDTRWYAEDAYNYVVEKWKSGKAKAVFLAGYSRGGAAMIEVAWWLKYYEKIPVECLILFDPVDRSISLGWHPYVNTEIVDAVQRVIYAQRDKWATHSRLTFGNCGYNRQNETTPYSYAQFFATHGGLGGTPWATATNPYTGEPRETIWELGEPQPTKVTPQRDKEGADRVWRWVYPQIASAYQACAARLKNENPTQPKPDFQVTPQIGGALPPTGGGNGKQRIYVVKQGDWLSKIALRYYGDAMKYDVIHKANLAKIGPNPNLIQPGQELVIPYI